MNNKISSEVRLSVTTTTTTTTAEVTPDAIDIDQSCSAKSVEDAVVDKPQLATWSDVFAMAKGCLLPIVMINFSSLIHGFVKIDEETLVSNSSTTISAVTFSAVNSTITLPFSNATNNLNFTFTNIATLFGPINIVDCFNLLNPNDLEQFHRQLRFLYTNQTSNWTDLPQRCRRLALDTAGEIIMFNVYGYLVIAAAIFLTAFVHSLCWNISAVRQCSAMRREMFRGIMRQDIGWFDAEEANSRQLPTQLSECVNKIQDGLQQIDMFFENTCGFLAAFTVALVYGWELGLIIMGITPFIALSGWFMMRVSSRASAHEMLAYARAGAVAEETFANIRTVAALGCEQKQAEKYSQALEPATNAGVRKGVAVGIGQGAIWGVIFVSYALAFGVGAWLVRRSIYNGNDGRYNVGTLVVVFLCVQIGARQLGQIMPNLQEIANIQAAAHVVVQIVRQTPIIDSACSSGQHPLSTIGKISFKSVSFSYPARQDAQILENFSLEIESGTTVALVGASGCGKSTIVQLLERFYDPTSGAILIDDIDLRDWNVAHLRNVIGIVGQEPVLFSTTIGENIRLGRQTLTDIKQAEMDDACRKANIYDFIQCLLQNYSTPVGNKGSQLLSGGEKQRIAIARAIIKAPPILLLDEATSALDSNSERLVQQAIDNIATVSGQRRRTVIVVAHRLSTIVNADKIVALKDGQIVESGTHAELMSKKGLYFSLVQAQISQGVKRRRRKESDATCSDSSGDSGNDDDSDGENRARKPHKEAFEKMKANGLLSMAAMLASTATNATSRRKTLSPLPTIITRAPSNDRDNSPAPHLPRSRAASLVQSTLNYARSARNSLLPSPTFYNAGAAAEADGGDESNVSAAVSATAALDMMSMHLCVSPFHSDRRPSSYSAVFRAVQEEKVAEEEEIERNFGGFSRAESMMPSKTAHDSNPKHKPRPKGPQLVRLIRMNAPEWWLILLGLIGAICTGAIMPVYAVLLSEMLRVFADPDLQRQAREAIFWSLMFLVLGMVCFVANLFQFSLLGVAGERLTTRLRRRVFSAILRQDVQFFDQPRNHVGALTTRLTTDTAAVQAATGSALALIVQSACTLAVAFGIGIYFAWKVVLVCIGTIPFIMAGSFLEQKILTRQAVSSQSALEKASSIVAEAVEQIRTVTMLNLQHHFVHEFEKQMHHANRNALVRACTMSFAFAYSQSIRFVAFSLAFWAGWQFIRASWLDDEQKLKFDFSDMLKALFGIMYGAISIGQASSFTQSFGKAKISSARIFRLIDQRPKIDLSDNGLCPPEALGNIEFKNVRFRHVTRRTMPLLRGLSLKIQPKQSFALVGHSGCGKSTIFQLLLRFYEPQEGEILLDGKEIEKYNLKWLRKQFALVGQEPVLFSGTVRENIGYGCEQPPSYEEIVAAATAANAHAFIMQLPQQYETFLGNTGHVQLSGGQKQRIAIACALARKPRILLLDEATSALDTESEQLVQKALLNASKGVTSITIAHRLPTIENCDAIAVIDKGRLAEFGTHKQLMQLKDHGMYFKAQQQTSLKTDKPATRNDSAKITKML